MLTRSFPLLWFVVNQGRIMQRTTNVQGVEDTEDAVLRGKKLKQMEKTQKQMGSQ